MRRRGYRRGPGVLDGISVYHKSGIPYTIDYLDIRISTNMFRTLVATQTSFGRYEQALEQKVRNPGLYQKQFFIAKLVIAGLHWRQYSNIQDVCLFQFYDVSFVV
eukprot:TRINITY_DN15777_c0_g1_i1.p3 TRINITY_DN15777_c0_g1~~TRINITY_DN15777_c0_g1_i1.p3  ORF type:complete len:105 (-),score=1.01 TRINITY_DN15777_c0_g1_i1:111-425(-)